MVLLASNRRLTADPRALSYAAQIYDIPVLRQLILRALDHRTLGVMTRVSRETLREAVVHLYREVESQAAMDAISNSPSPVRLPFSPCLSQAVTVTR